MRQPCIHRPHPVRAAALRCALVVLCGLAGLPALAAVWQVGPAPGDLGLAAALRQAQDGDEIQVAPGHYPGQVAVITHKRLTIRGVGQRPVFSANGQHAEGKAIWVVRDGDIRIENIEFRGARVPDGNGAGIRFQRGRLQVSDCLFTDNQMGLLTADEPGAVLHIQRSEFSHAPPNPGTLAHLLYVGRIAEFSLRHSRLHHGREGHLVKSRAAVSTLSDNLIDDGPDGQASYEVDLPNGGQALLERNTIGQGARTRNEVMLSFGAEGHGWPDSRLTLRDNRFINRRGGAGVFVRVWPARLPAGTAVSSHRNRWLGGGQWQWGPALDSAGDSTGALPPEDAGAARR